MTRYKTIVVTEEWTVEHIGNDPKWCHTEYLPDWTGCGNGIEWENVTIKGTKGSGFDGDLVTYEFNCGGDNDREYFIIVRKIEE